MRIDEQLKRAILNYTGTAYQVCKGSGVSSPIMSRFLSGERGINLETAAKLADFLGMELTPKQPRIDGASSTAPAASKPPKSVKAAKTSKAKR
jgi:transcriptional regulator with XRE-family HTH domain